MKFFSKRKWKKGQQQWQSQNENNNQTDRSNTSKFWYDWFNIIIKLSPTRFFSISFGSRDNRVYICVVVFIKNEKKEERQKWMPGNEHINKPDDRNNNIDKVYNVNAIISKNHRYQKQPVDSNGALRRSIKSQNTCFVDLFFGRNWCIPINSWWQYRYYIPNEQVDEFSGWLVHVATRYCNRKSSYRWKENLAFFCCFVANFEQR